MQDTANKTRQQEALGIFSCGVAILGLSMCMLKENERLEELNSITKTTQELLTEKGFEVKDKGLEAALMLAIVKTSILPINSQEDMQKQIAEVFDTVWGKAITDTGVDMSAVPVAENVC